MLDSLPRLIGLGLLTTLVVACNSPLLPALAGEAGTNTSVRVTGPMSGGDHGFPFVCTTLDLAAHGFIEEEHFVDGTARAYSSSAIDR